MKIHRMNLLKEPYTEIKEGRKTVEMRLCDEKRQGIAVGDLIIFSCGDFPCEELHTEVDGIYIYEDFHILAENFAPESLGFCGCTPEFISNYMEKIYGTEKVKKYGAFAIKILLKK